MLAQITVSAKWSYASYAPAPTEHPLYLRGGAVSLPSKAERLASSPSKIEGVSRSDGGV